MTEFECRICNKTIESDTSHKKLFDHLSKEHTKEEIIPHMYDVTRLEN